MTIDHDLAHRLTLLGSNRIALEPLVVLSHEVVGKWLIQANREDLLLHVLVR